jgi:hypothetical protein
MRLARKFGQMTGVRMVHMRLMWLISAPECELEASGRAVDRGAHPPMRSLNGVGFGAEAFQHVNLTAVGPRLCVISEASQQNQPRALPSCRTSVPFVGSSQSAGHRLTHTSVQNRALSVEYTHPLICGMRWVVNSR